MQDVYLVPSSPVAKKAFRNAIYSILTSSTFLGLTSELVRLYGIVHPFGPEADFPQVAREPWACQSSVSICLGSVTTKDHPLIKIIELEANQQLAVDMTEIINSDTNTSPTGPGDEADPQLAADMDEILDSDTKSVITDPVDEDNPRNTSPESHFSTSQQSPSIRETSAKAFMKTSQGAKWALQTPAEVVAEHIDDPRAFHQWGKARGYRVVRHCSWGIRSGDLGLFGDQRLNATVRQHLSANTGFDAANLMGECHLRGLRLILFVTDFTQLYREALRQGDDEPINSVCRLFMFVRVHNVASTLPRQELEATIEAHKLV